MANQAIALQTRAPQGNFLAPAIQQGAQMINMMRQQQELNRQATAQQQQLEIARAAEARAVEKAAIDKDVALYEKHRRLAPLVRDVNTYTKFLGGVAKDSPETADMLMDALPPDQFNPDTFVLLMGKMDDVFKAQYGTAITRDVITPEGVVMGANISSIPGKSFAAPIPDISQPRAPAAPPPTAPSAAAPAPAGGGMFRPAAFSPGQDGGMDADAGLRAVQTAMQTKTIDPATLDQVRQLAGPQAAAVDAWMQKNGIQVTPDAGMRSAIYRSDGAAPLAQQVNYDPNAFAPLRAKSPMVSPMPGSASVPLERVRAEAAAGRQTPAEAAAVAAATETARRAAELKAEQAKKLPAKRQVSTLLQKIRSAYETLNKAEAIPSTERGTIENVFDYLSTTGPGREIQRALGTKANKSLNEITGSRKLLATAIKNATGMSAQEMNSNVELQLTLDALTDPTQGYESAISQLDTLEQLYGAGNAKTATETKGPRKTPVDKPPAGISADDWKFMTPEERRLWQK